MKGETERQNIVGKAIDTITDYWDHRSDTYEPQHEITNVDAWKQKLQELIGADREQKIVDLATGTGMIANLLGEMGYKAVTGMDISEGMMDVARRHARERNTGVKFVYGNALDLPLADSSIDVLINCRLLWTLVDAKGALQEWIRAVRPGGRIISIHEMQDEPPEADWIRFTYGEDADPYIELKRATRDEFVQFYQESGLTDVRLCHMDGCTSKENHFENWYALTGTKEEKSK